MSPAIPLNTVAGLASGPLCPFVEQYVAQVQALGYKATSVRYQLRLIAGFNRWLRRTRRDVADIDAAVVRQFLRSRRNRRSHHGERSILRRFCSVIPITERFEIPERPRCTERTAWIVDPYRNYLLNERGLAAHTGYAYSRWVDEFLSVRFEGQPMRLVALRGRDLTTFVQQAVPQCGRARAIHLVAALRSFCLFLRYAGYIQVDLGSSVPPVAQWSVAEVPKHLSSDDVEKVLTACDRNTVLGRRDYAILLLLARLGLRGGEVLGLMLEDIDWDSGTITIPVTKNRRGARLPLPSDVGKAIAEYLRRDRPQCDCRRVFIRTKAPHVGLSASPVISTIARKALRRAGVQSPRAGAHVFRHSFATTMLGRGASLPEIGQLLRHNNPKTTAIYAKVDVETLRSIALPWPGGAK
jgi:site-specific recombinase XerD